MFKISKKSKLSRARAGSLKTNHGEIKTPFFMPVATRGAVKHVSAAEIEKLGAPILLSNTYHLMLRPGEKLVKKAGGLHAFMGWSGPILTDSGGFQVFSLAGNKGKSGKKLVTLTQRGARFRSHIDGRAYFLSPERSLKIQLDLGVDIAVCLDECAALPARRADLERAVALTSQWAKRTKEYYKKINSKNKINKKAAPLLFAVIQGGLDKDLRLKSLNKLVSLDFDGYNIGGLAVGEKPQERARVLDYLAPAMPEDKPRYLMGIGYPEDIVSAARQGIDMFDCVIPTREGRHGRLFFWNKNHESEITNHEETLKAKIRNSNRFYTAASITNAKFASDFSPINAGSKLPELRDLSRAYLHHLFKINEPLGARLATLNNLEFYLDLMIIIRNSIKSNRF